MIVIFISLYLLEQLVKLPIILYRVLANMLGSINNMYYGQFATNGGTLYKEHERRFYINLQQLLNYSRTFAGVHNVDVLLGHETYNMNTETVSAYKTKMFSLENLELGGAVIDGQQAGSSRSEYNNEGFFIRAQYDYADKFY